jgi:copper homeostasis protein (lipoprotein)
MKTALPFAVLILSILISSCGSTKEQPKKGGADGAHNSKNSLDWQGTYWGVLPCADCSGIRTAITLQKDGYYRMKTRYEGKSREVFETKGPFTWDKKGAVIMLGDARYQVGENQLIRLDQSGQVITGDLAEKYILLKAGAGPEGISWRMIEAAGRVIVSDSLNPPAWIRLDAAEKRMNGNSGCNSISGRYELQEMSRIKFMDVISTMMACPEMMNESLLLRAVNSADSFHLSNDTLVLHRAKMAPLARFKADFFVE